MTDNGNNANVEIQMMTLAGMFTTAWVETLACLAGTSGDDSAQFRNRLLLQFRDAKLAEADVAEKLLGITPTTAEIRKWYKNRSE